MTWPKLEKLVTNSQAMKDSYIRSGIDQSSVSVLHCFAPDLQNQVDSISRHGEPLILFAGRIIPEKGLDDVLKALNNTGGKTRLTVVGEGIDMEHCQSLARKLNLADRVNFVGWQTDLEPFYRKASLVVVPSLWPEPFGIVGIEAMSYGLPVVAYRSGGIPEWLDDGITGTLVEPGNINGLAAAINDLLSNPEKARTMGEAGRQRQRELFSAERHILQLEEIYEEAIRDWRSRNSQ